MKLKNNSRILVLDIETRPAKAYIWKMFDENISLEQLIEPSSILCVGAMWLGSKTCLFFSEWEHGKLEMLKHVHSLLSEADAVVGYNSDRFDLAKLNGEFLLYGLAPVPPLTSIDLYKQIKKMGLQSAKLAYVGPFLGIGSKVAHEGFALWKGVMDGNAAARNRMKGYCIGDVKLTVNLYLRLRPYIKNHPHLGESKSASCGACGSKHLQSRGYRRTKAFKIQRLHCQGCGSWSDGSRVKV